MGKAGSQEVEAREGDDAAVVEGDGRPAGALEWRSLPFRPTMWQVISAQASGPLARARASSWTIPVSFTLSTPINDEDNLS